VFVGKVDHYAPTAGFWLGHKAKKECRICAKFSSRWRSKAKFPSQFQEKIKKKKSFQPSLKVHLFFWHGRYSGTAHTSLQNEVFLRRHTNKASL
jgi:hypothetical protein